MENFSEGRRPSEPSEKVRPFSLPPRARRRCLQWEPMPRNTLLPSRVPWVSWVSMVLRWETWRSQTKIQWTSWGFRVGFLVEGFLWPSSYRSVSRCLFWPTTFRGDTLTASRSPNVHVPSLSKPPVPRSGATRYPLAGHGVSPRPPSRHAKLKFSTVAFKTAKCLPRCPSKAPGELQGVQEGTRGQKDPESPRRIKLKKLNRELSNIKRKLEF